MGDVFVGIAHLVRGAAEHDDSGRRPYVAQQWGEELKQPAQSRRVGDPGGVEDQTAEGVGPSPAEVVTHDVVVVGQCDP